MKKTGLNYFILMCLICTTIISGFYRDFVFKNINALLKALDYAENYVLPSSLAFLKDLDYTILLRIKWILTVVCTLLFLGISMVFIKIIFNKKKYIRYTVWSYVVVTVISFILMLLGFIFNSYYEKFYLFSRYLMGMAQSPIIIMILIPAFKIAEIQQKKEIQKEIRN